MLRIRQLLPAAIFAAALPLAAADAAEPNFLTIGDKAPPLDVEHWFSTGNGFDQVSDFEPGRVYVVEFWATWCGPCIASMPELAKLQDKYADKGVQIVSISDESKEKVEKFLERNLPGYEEPEEGEEAEESDEPTTYGELTSAYSLTTDPDESAYKDYMRAASQNGIPSAFIVGKTGLVEWIGHPMRMKSLGILDDVLDGSYDREAFKKEFEEEQKYDRLQSIVFSSLQSGENQKALDAVDKFKAENPDASANPMFRQIELTTLMRAGDAAGFTKAVMASVKAATVPSEAIGPARALAMGAEGMDIPAKSLKAAIVEIGRFEDDVEGGEAAYLYDTIARLEQASGNFDAAVTAQKKAIKAAEGTPLLPRVKQGLDQIEAARKDAEKED